MHALSVIGIILLVLIGIGILFLVCLFSKVVFGVFSFILEFIFENIRYVIAGIIILIVIWALIIE